MVAMSVFEPDLVTGLSHHPASWRRSIVSSVSRPRTMSTAARYDVGAIPACRLGVSRVGAVVRGRRRGPRFSARPGWLGGWSGHKVVYAVDWLTE